MMIQVEHSSNLAVGNGTTKLPSIDWRSTTCGGDIVNETADCILYDETGNLTGCKCLSLSHPQN